MSEKMSDEVPAKKSSALEADAEGDDGDDEEQYSREEEDHLRCYIWCIKCEKLLYDVCYSTLQEQREILAAKEWKCDRCEPKVRSLHIYSTNNEHQSHWLMKAYINNYPYREPYWLCNDCLFLHDDDYEGRCAGAYECNGVEDVSVYWGWDYEDAKGLERKRRRQSQIAADATAAEITENEDSDEDSDEDSAEDSDDNPPSLKRARVDEASGVIDLTGIDDGERKNCY